MALPVSATDPDGDALEYTFGSPSHGTISGTPPSATYTPAANYSGEDTVSVRVSDGRLDSTATITLTITPVNDSPIAAADAFTTPEDTALSVPLATLVANDTDAEGQALTVTTAASAVSGTVAIAGSDVVFTPDADFHGTASFEYEVTDGAATSTGQVTVTVTPVNDAPVASASRVVTDMDVPAPLTLAATDVDGDSLSFTVVGNPSNGTLTGTGASLTYAPNAGFVGNDSFTFRANDGSLDSNVAKVSITVVPLTCGNGTLDSAEECDDGNRTNGDGCNAACRVEACGDGVVNGSEVCDDGNRDAGDGCRADCRGREVCGDGLTDSLKGEQCDDENTAEGDGCSATCQLDAFTSVPAQAISGALSCGLGNSNTGRKVGVDQLGRFYVVMNCGGEGYVSSSVDRGVTWSAPISTGITGVQEIAIEGGSAGVAYVAAKAGGNLVFIRTADAGGTWAAPTTLATGTTDAEVSIDSFDAAVYISVRNGTGLRILRNFARGVGAFESVDLAQTNSFHEVIVDKISGDILSVSDTPQFHVRRSSDQGVTFGEESLPPGQAYFSDWTGSNGFVYVVGTWSASTDVDVIPLSDPSTSTQVQGLPLVGIGPTRSIDADALGNAYVASTLDSGKIQLDRMLFGASAVASTDARIIEDGTAPAVAALPSNTGALIAFTKGTTVYAAVVVY